ncbi:MAG: pyrroline-5-carboxylate reductase [Rubrivivax sp.]|nr:pyrroline-5-carboxylate reductase [Rubrivivax sp.]
MAQQTLAFIGGGNMAGAIFGGLVRSGWPAAAITVVEPWTEQRERIAAAWPGVRVLAAADAPLAAAAVVVWAVKPQSFAAAAAPCAGFVGSALHLSVMAGIRSDALVRATGSQRVVRAMPNTPALIGQGIAGLFARGAASAADRNVVQAVLAPTGQCLWFEREEQLDAVTALSGSGPAYVFFFIEAMIDAAEQMGLTREQGRRLAQATFTGATALAAQSDEPLALLRERVTSKGGTTFAALESMRSDKVHEAIVRAVRAAQQRARELGASA